MFDLACSLGKHMGTYFSGYPKWKLPSGSNFQIRSFPFRTLVTYGLLRFPSGIRPKDDTLYIWQDKNFDKKVASSLSYSDFIHAMPGQCIQTFQKAKELGIKTVLNHATGPVDLQLDLVREEYRRVGLEAPDLSNHANYFLSLVDREFELTDYHCVASSVVKLQLIQKGVDEKKIWVVPYGADTSFWKNSEQKEKSDFLEIVFAGQLSLRKGLKYLLDALELAGERNWRLNVYGRKVSETMTDIKGYSGKISVKYHGAVSQNELCRVFQESDLLILPSLEEGFGLVITQALSCGTPCIVSDKVGAKDLITEECGAVFDSMDSRDLLEKIECWAARKSRIQGDWSWTNPAKKLIEYSMAALNE